MPAPHRSHPARRLPLGTGRVIAIERLPERLRLAERLGAEALEAYDRVKQALHLSTDRAESLRQAIAACRKGGTLAILGVFGLVDKFPVGVMMNKGLTVRTAQQHAQRYVPRLLDHVAKGELDTGSLAAHRMTLEESVRGYQMFKEKQDGCIRSVFVP